MPPSFAPALQRAEPHRRSADLFELYVTAENYRHRSLLANFYKPLLDRIRVIPGVTGAGVIDLIPVMDSGSNSDISIVGKPPALPHQEMLAEDRMITPGTLETLGARLVAGRALSDSLDRADTPLVLTVNLPFVRNSFYPVKTLWAVSSSWGS